MFFYDYDTFENSCITTNCVGASFKMPARWGLCVELVGRSPRKDSEIELVIGDEHGKSLL